MKQLAVLVALIATITGCEEEVPTLSPGLTFQVGDRLSPRLQLADDGTLFFGSSSWNDSYYGVCSFHNGEDGKWRCVPEVPRQNGDLFADTQCTQKVFVQPYDVCIASVDKYVVVEKDPGPCETEPRWSVYTVSKDPVSLAAVYRLSGDTCLEAMKFMGPMDGTIYLVNGSIPAAGLVSAWR